MTRSPWTTRSKKVRLVFPLLSSLPLRGPFFPHSLAPLSSHSSPPLLPVTSALLLSFPLSPLSVPAAYSHVVENTAFFGDVVLRFPRIVHHYYDRNSEWGGLLRWGLNFCNQTGVFTGGAHQHVLTLVRAHYSYPPPPLTCASWASFLLVLNLNISNRFCDF